MALLVGVKIGWRGKEEGKWSEYTIVPSFGRRKYPSKSTISFHPKSERKEGSEQTFPLSSHKKYLPQEGGRGGGVGQK